MFKQIVLGTLMLLAPIQASAARINFSGGYDNYNVNGYLDYDSTEIGTLDHTESRYTHLSFQGAKMYVSLNGGAMRTGGTSLLATIAPDPLGSYISSQVDVDLNLLEAFSLVVYFPTDIVKDGKIITRLPQPDYGEIAHVFDNDAYDNTDLKFSFSSSVPELGTWMFMILGLFASGACLRRRTILQAQPLPAL